MGLSSWLWTRTSDRAPPVRAQHRPAAPRFRPALEMLERRDVPSTLTVTNNLDSAAGSLRAEVAAANPGDTINFAPSLNGQTITLSSGELLLNKSLTIDGPGAGQLAISGGLTWGVGINAGKPLGGFARVRGDWLRHECDAERPDNHRWVPPW